MILLKYPPRRIERSIFGGAVECPDTEWGRSIITEVNQVLYRIRDTKEFRDLNKRWFVSKAVVKDYWGKYKELILDVSK